MSQLFDRSGLAGMYATAYQCALYGSELLNIAANNSFRASKAIMVPAPTILNFQARVALSDSMPGIALAIVSLKGHVDFDLFNEGLNPWH